MNLQNGIKINDVATFGELRFMGMLRETLNRNELGEATDEVKKRIYLLKSSAQGSVIRVQVPPNVALKEFAKNTLVRLINPIVDTVANRVGNQVSITWFIDVDDIVKSSDSSASPSTPRFKDNASKDGEKGNV
jgi:Bacterial protein of unknown function (DUF961).